MREPGLAEAYDFLRARGYEPQGETVVIGNWPVRLLTAGVLLLEEAAEQAPQDAVCAIGNEWHIQVTDSVHLYRVERIVVAGPRLARRGVALAEDA